MIDLKSKIEKFKSERGRIFGLVYPYILIIIVAVGLYYISNLNNVARQNIPVAVPDTTTQTDLPIIEPRTIPPINILELKEPSQELIAEGKENYTKICLSCHGEDGNGSGPASTGLNPSPRNFTSKEGWKNGQKISQIYQTLEEGIPGSAMISYNYLSPAERVALAHYIRDTFIPDPPKDTEADLTALDQTYSLSKGKEIPAQIPVQKAIDIIVEENSSVVYNITQKLNLINSSNNSGARIFKEVSSNRFKALTLLNSDQSWKQDYHRFVNSLVYNINRNGFNDNLFKLSSNEWDMFYNYMNGIF